MFDQIERTGSLDCLGGTQLPSTDPTQLGTIRFAMMNFVLVQGVGACYFNATTALWHPLLCTGNPPVFSWGQGINLSGNLAHALHGTGSPQGVVTPQNVGDIYIDDATGALYWSADGTINGWKP